MTMVSDGGGIDHAVAQETGSAVINTETTGTVHDRATGRDTMTEMIGAGTDHGAASINDETNGLSVRGSVKPRRSRRDHVLGSRGNDARQEAGHRT
jgi:hypothetical protein